MYSKYSFEKILNILQKSWENAITALKFLALNNDIDCIASGSMLGIAYKSVTSFPVGYVERLEMHSLDFEEFCWANGINEEIVSSIKKYYEELSIIPEFTHKKMLELFRNYIVVGGMPQVVESFIETKHYGQVLNVQRNIIKSYKDDIVKYADDYDKNKIRQCFDSIPKHLAQNNKKFRYKLVDKQGSAGKYYGSLEWLKDAGIISFCYNLSKPELPLEGNSKEDIFKVYMRDTGLLVAMLEDGSQQDIINGNLEIYKGAIYENVIADIFTKNGKKLYYFEYNSTLEIDFFIRYKETLTAVEVKSADNTKSKSLDSVMNNWVVTQGIRLSAKNIGYNKNKNIYVIPLYMAILLK